MRPLIGNRQRFAFELHPVRPSWDRHYLPEQTAWAGLAIWINGLNLCMHVDRGGLEVREYLYVPLGPLADWFARVMPALTFEERPAHFPRSGSAYATAARWADARHPATISTDDWLDEREAWWSRHFLQAGAEGARVPNLAFIRDDEKLVLEWRRPYWTGQGSLLAMHPVGAFAVDWDEGSAVLSEFVAGVGEWLREEVGPVYDWVESGPAPGTLAERTQFLTGREPQQVADILALDGGLGQLGLSETDDPASIPELQALRDLSPSLSGGFTSVLRDLSERSTSVDHTLDEALRSARVLAWDAARGGESLEGQGQEAAAHLRVALGLNGDPIGDLGSLLSRIGVEVTNFAEASERDRMVVLKRSDAHAVAGTLDTSRTQTEWGRRFEAARAAGHALLDPLREGALGAAAGPFAQRTRRRRSGAFAAELLLPETALREASRERLDGAADDQAFGSLLESNGVGARTAAFQLWNRGWLSGSDVRDELIDRFATTQ